MRQFQFKLALSLGRTVSELLEDLSYAELIEWMAYDQLDPIDIRYRNDVSNAITASTIANVNRGKNTSPYSPDKFIPTYGNTTEQPKQSWEVMLDQVKNYTNALKKHE